MQSQTTQANMPTKRKRQKRNGRHHHSISFCDVCYTMDLWLHTPDSVYALSDSSGQRDESDLKVPHERLSNKPSKMVFFHSTLAPVQRNRTPWKPVHHRPIQVLLDRYAGPGDIAPTTMTWRILPLVSYSYEMYSYKDPQGPSKGCLQKAIEVIWIDSTCPKSTWFGRFCCNRPMS